jgi:serine/threonine-protein kinase HipA
MFTECYVFEANSVPPVVIGKYWIEDGIGKFVYGQSYLKNPAAFAIDPINLPLSDAQFIPKRGKDVFNVLADAGVDNWGRRLIVATHAKAPKNAVEWLLAASGRGAGSLLFSASRTSLKAASDPIPIDQLTAYIEVVQGVVSNVDHFEIPQKFVKLVEHGQSMGGARPKTLVMCNGIEYIAKLNRSDDALADLSRVENASMTMAKMCGINVAKTWCIDQGAKGSILMVERFDRTAGNPSRTHYISAHSLLDFSRVTADDYKNDYSYAGIAKKIMAISASPQEDARELFRRMVFNGLIGNSDDHLRNHGFVMTDRKKQKYRLSPAFDILPHPLEHPQLLAIGCGKEGQLATYDNFLSRAESFYLTHTEARIIIEELRDIVSRYAAVFKDIGVSNHDLKLMERCFDLTMTPMPQTANVKLMR